MKDTFNAGRVSVLERVAAGAPLPELLAEIVRFIERQSTGMMCSILLLDPEGRCIRHGAAPSLPPEFARSLDGSRVGPHAGSCGAAAYLGKQIIVSDIATHPNWADYRHLALPYGMRACWSTPIFSPEQEVLGTFAMYYREIREPSPEELHWVDVATHLASIAILRDRNEQQLRYSEQRARQLARLYAVSNGVNETIAHVRDTQQLYNFACQIAVDQGLARQAWVGLCVKSNEAVLPKARYGPRSELLDSVELQLADERISQGPTVRAIKTGEPALSNDIANDKNFYMKELAEMCGVKSCAVFPLKAGGRVFGIFALGADQANYFRAEEIQVLTMLAADISQAVESIVNERERHRMEAALRANETLRAFVYSSVEDVIFYLSVEEPGQYRFLSANPAFLKATGLEESDVVGKLVNDVIPEPSLSLALEKYNQAISQREKVIWQEITTYPTGQKYGNVTVCPIFDSEGRCTNLVGTVHDITELTQEADRRLSLETQLHHSQRMQALGTLVGGVAHDFNSILSAVSIGIEAAVSESGADSPIRGYLVEIEKATHRAKALVRQILSFGRRDPPQRKMIDLRPIIEEALQIVRSTVPSNIAIMTRCGSDTPTISADATQIHQIVMNLCLNAADAIGAPGGTIEIRVDAWEQNATLTSAPVELPEGSYARLSIADTGCGMDETTAKRVFEPFFTTKPPDKGTGLGLSVVDGIVKGHSGAIEVKSTLGQGTTFTLYFPVNVAPATEEALVMPVQGNNVRVLGRLGYRITAHSNSLAALQDFRSRPDEFDIVMTDITMPGLSGPDLVKEVRRLRPTISVVMLSGYIRPEDREIAGQLQVNRLLYKPSTIDELSHTLSQEIGALAPSKAGPASKN